MSVQERHKVIRYNVNQRQQGIWQLTARRQNCNPANVVAYPSSTVESRLVTTIRCAAVRCLIRNTGTLSRTRSSGTIIRVKVRYAFEPRTGRKNAYMAATNVMASTKPAGRSGIVKNGGRGSHGRCGKTSVVHRSCAWKTAYRRRGVTQQEWEPGSVEGRIRQANAASARSQFTKP